jgi:hypothetical protein
MTTYEERRDRRFHGATIAVLNDIHARALQQSPELWYSTAYGILRGYFESLLTNFAEAFSTEQLAEIRIVLDQLSAVVREDYLDDATKRKLDQLAQALRESEAQV